MSSSIYQIDLENKARTFVVVDDDYGEYRLYTFLQSLGLPKITALTCIGTSLATISDAEIVPAGNFREVLQQVRSGPVGDKLFVPGVNLQANV
jgi:hypothetical protein